MNDEHTERTIRLEREKAVFLYTSALERGDIGTVALMLEAAQHDALLERMILEVNDVLGRESDEALAAEVALDADASRVDRILRECLPSGAPDADGDLELPPLTVRNVLARMQEDASLRAGVRQEAASLQRTLREPDAVLPDDLSQGGVRRMFGGAGAEAGELLQKMFRRVALLLTMGREQHTAQLAAARRQRRKHADASPSRESEEQP